MDPPAAKGNPKKMRKSKLARYRCVGRWAAYCSAPPLAGEGWGLLLLGGKGVQDRDTQEREDQGTWGAGQGYSFLLLVFVVVIAVVVAVVIVFVGGG